MAKDVMQEYLVSIGYQVNRSELNEVLYTINALDRTVSQVMGLFGKTAEKASRGIMATLAATGKAVAAFTLDVASADIETEKWARRMWMTEETARSFQFALAAMGATWADIEDIAANQELNQRFRDLRDLAQEAAAPPELQGMLKDLRGVWQGVQEFRVLLANIPQHAAFAFLGDMREELQELKSWMDGINASILENLPEIGRFVARVVEGIIHGVEKAIKFLSLLKDTLSNIISVSPLANGLNFVGEKAFGWDEDDDWSEKFAKAQDSVSNAVDRLLLWFQGDDFQGILAAIKENTKKAADYLAPIVEQTKEDAKQMGGGFWDTFTSSFEGYDWQTPKAIDRFAKTFQDNYGLQLPGAAEGWGALGGGVLAALLGLLDWIAAILIDIARYVFMGIDAVLEIIGSVIWHLNLLMSIILDPLNADKYIKQLTDGYKRSADEMITAFRESKNEDPQSDPRDVGENSLTPPVYGPDYSDTLPEPGTESNDSNYMNFDRPGGWLSMTSEEADEIIANSTEFWSGVWNGIKKTGDVGVEVIQGMIDTTGEMIDMMFYGWLHPTNPPASSTVNSDPWMMEKAKEVEQRNTVSVTNNITIQGNADKEVMDDAVKHILDGFDMAWG
jgi:hypothetical protein